MRNTDSPEWVGCDDLVRRMTITDVKCALGIPGCEFCRRHYASITDVHALIRGEKCTDPACKICSDPDAWNADAAAKEAALFVGRNMCKQEQKLGGTMAYPDVKPNGEKYGWAEGASLFIEPVLGQPGVAMVHNARLKRAEAIIEIMRVFYADQVRQAEAIADTALGTPRNTL